LAFDKNLTDISSKRKPSDQNTLALKINDIPTETFGWYCYIASQVLLVILTNTVMGRTPCRIKYDIHQTNHKPKHPRILNFKKGIDDKVKKWMDVILWDSWPYFGHDHTLWAFCRLLDDEKLPLHKLWVTTIKKPKSQRATPCLKNLQRNSIFKSTLC